MGKYFVQFDILCISLVLVCLLSGAVSAEAYENPQNTHTPDITNANNAVEPNSLAGNYNTLTPYLILSEEYNDNIFLTAHNREDDFITRITPGFRLNYTSRLWVWNANAAVSYLHFAKGTEGDQLYPDIWVNGHIRPVRNFFYIDVSDDYRRVPLNTAYDSLFANQADQNFFRVSPYLKFNASQRLEIMTGYAYENVSYSEPYTISWQEHDLFLRATYQMTPRSKCFADLTYAHTITDQNVNYDVLSPSVGLDYTYADRSHIYLQGGYSLIHTSEGRDFTSPYWKVGIDYYFGRYVAYADGSVVYNTDPYRIISQERTIKMGLTRQFNRGTLGLFAYYYRSGDYYTNSVFQKIYGLGLLGTYEFSNRLKGHFVAKGGRERGTLFIGPYYYYTPLLNENASYYWHLYLNAGLDYELEPALGLSLSYIHDSYLYGGGDSSNIYDNRVIVTLVKTFRGLRF